MNLPRDYTLGATLLERYEAKVNTGRKTIRAVNDTLLDPANPHQLNGEAAPEIIKIAFEVSIKCCHQ